MSLYVVLYNNCLNAKSAGMVVLASSSESQVTVEVESITDQQMEEKSVVSQVCCFMNSIV